MRLPDKALLAAVSNAGQRLWKSARNSSAPIDNLAGRRAAVRSAANDLTLIAEDELQPLSKDGANIKTRNMNLHQFPWPGTQLEELGEAEVELRVTLSYFIEPNPGERGWLRRHRYPSHGLRLSVKRALESVDDFRRRINAAVTAEEQGLSPVPAVRDHWSLGRIRDVGSIHSDYWRGTAAELAQRSTIGTGSTSTARWARFP